MILQINVNVNAKSKYKFIVTARVVFICDLFVWGVIKAK